VDYWVVVLVVLSAVVMGAGLLSQLVRLQALYSVAK
jgi:hypothetical protein